MLSTLVIAGAVAIGPIFHPPLLSPDKPEINIDGVLDETAWSEAAVISEFSVVVPDTMATPAHRTLARVFYTEDGLYVGVWAEQPRDTQVSRLSTHDVWLEGDFIQIAVDPTGEGRYGQIFGIFLGGSAADATLLPERRYNWDWDGPWRRATKSFADGWNAEVFLPWSMFAIPRSTSAKRTMGIYLARWSAVKNERWSWPALPQTKPRFLSAFQSMAIAGIEPRPQVTGYPYLASSYDVVTESPGVRAGVDAFYSPSARTRISATVLPEFGQVDADDLVVNLSAFETFVPEKRPFFTEGHGIFETGRVNLVHTRRVGSAPRMPVPIDEDAKVENLAGAADILAAAKITGELGSVRYGLMGATEAAEEYQVRTGDMVTPAMVDGRDFVAGRVLYENAANGYQSLGLLGTLVHTPSTTAAVTAIDGQYHTPRATWQASGQIIGSMTTAESGYGGWIENVLTPRQGHVHSLAVEHYGESLQVNDFGYLRRNDLSKGTYLYTLNRAMETVLSEYHGQLETSAGWNSDARLVESLLQTKQGGTFKNNITLDMLLGYRLPRWDDRNSRGHGAFRVEDGVVASLSVATDKSKSWLIRAGISGYGEDLGGLTRGLELGFRFTPSEHISIENTSAVTQLDDWLVWDEGTLFGTYDGLQLSSRLDLGVLISPRQQLKLGAQWIGVRAQSTGAWEIANDGVLVPSLTGAVDSDIVEATFALQIRYRYEFAPLSDVFVVYSYGGSELEPGPYGELLRESIFRPTASWLMLKVRYRFDV